MSNTNVSWDMSSEFCPHGHIKDGEDGCMIFQTNSSRKNAYPVCKIRKRQQSAASRKRRKLGISVRPRGRPRNDQPIDMELDPNKIHPLKRGGTELSGSGAKAYIQLVCGHISVYDRSKLSYGSNRPNYEELLFCQVDREWFHVHKVGGIEATDQAMLLYPLEVAAKKACFLQSQFLKHKEEDKIRSEKSIPGSNGHTSFSKIKDYTPGPVHSLSDLRLIGDNAQ